VSGYTQNKKFIVDIIKVTTKKIGICVQIDYDENLP